METPCGRRLVCGGPKACEKCLGAGVQAATLKLLRGGGAPVANIPALVSTACPGSTDEEIDLIARTLMQVDPATNEHRYVSVSDGNVCHRVSKLLSDIGKQKTTNSTSIGSTIEDLGVAINDISSSMLRRCNVDEVLRSSHQLVVRRATELSATNMDELVRALMQRGSSGASLAVVYAEYENACLDVHHKLADVTIVSHGRIWYASQG